MRAALDDAAGNIRAGAPALMTSIGSLHARVQRWLTAGAWGRLGAWAASRVVVGRPLPDVPGDVVEPKAIGGEQPHRRCAAPSLRAGIAPRELALPEVRHQLPRGARIIAPGEDGTIESAAGCALPLGLGWQLLAGPLRIRLRVLEGDMRDRMIGSPGVVTARPPRRSPAGAEHVGPPVAGILQRHRSGRGMKDDRSLVQECGVGIGVDRGIGRALGSGEVPSLLDEARELRHGDRSAVDRKAADLHLARRSLFGVEVSGAHSEATRRDLDHVLAAHPWIVEAEDQHSSRRCISQVAAVDFNRTNRAFRSRAFHPDRVMRVHPALPHAGLTMSELLASWNDTQARRSIVEFVESVTREESASYLPAAERIAVFDNDGTLWCEKPMPIELGFILGRLAEMVGKNAALRDRQPWKAACERDFAWLGAVITKHYHGDDSDVQVLMGGIVAAFAGMTVEEYATAADAFLCNGLHPTLSRSFRDCGYLPMIELLRYLEANGFTNFIASGGDRDFMRPVTEELYGIPSERGIGSSPGLRYQEEAAAGTPSD